MSVTHNSFVYSKIDPEFKVKWLEALRGDKYKQGREALRTKANGFCCLGVAADILDPTKWRYEPILEKYAWNGASNVLPLEADQKIGLRGNVETQLIGMNDKNVPFTKIADWIEKNL